jgi:lysophospholipase L1-like esterase
MRIWILLLFFTKVLVAQDVTDTDGDLVPDNDTITAIDSSVAELDTFIKKITPFDVSKYPYVGSEYNIMLGFDSSRGATFAFWPLLDSLLTHKNFRINVLHFGGSHIQADIYSNLIRDSMQSMDTGMAGPRGLIFPFKIIKTNNPNNYRVNYTGTWEGHRSAVSYHTGNWGVTGITATTVDTLATISIKVRDICASTPFTEIKVLCDTASGYTVELLPKDNIMVIEHHLSLGYYKFKLKVPTDSMHLVITKTDTINPAPFELYGIIMENDEPGIAYHSIGANGSSFRSNFRCDLFKQHLVEINPDLVIISIGTNDSFDGDFTEDGYMAKYDTFIQMIRAVNSDAQFILTVPNDSYYKRKYPNLNTAKTESAIYKLAVKHNALVWDCYKIMGGLRSSKKWNLAGMMKKDLIHFTHNGYILKGELFWDAFKRSYQNYLDSKTATPVAKP